MNILYIIGAIIVVFALILIFKTIINTPKNENIKLKENLYKNQFENASMEFVIEFVQRNGDLTICFGCISKGEIKIGNKMKYYDSQNKYLEKEFECIEIIGFDKKLSTANEKDNKNVGLIITDKNVVSENNKFIIEK